jgi:hypothetical protein
MLTSSRLCMQGGSTSGTMVPDVDWYIVIDDFLIKECGNVSEEYNDLFLQCKTRFGANIIPIRSFMQLDVHTITKSGVVFFEPATYGPLYHSNLYSKCGKMPTSIVILDDVDMCSIGVDFATCMGSFILACYPERVSVPCTPWMHGAATIFCETVLPPAEERALTCVIAGQSNVDYYPERNRFRLAKYPGTVVLPPPAYTPPKNKRVEPIDLIHVLLGASAAYVGGGKHSVMVSKHFEFGACGNVILTDTITAGKLHEIGIHAETWDSIRDEFHIRLPGVLELRNRELILSKHQVWMRARELYTHVITRAMRA